MLLLEVAFNRFNLHKVYSAVLSFNQASLRYAHTCGYREEGRLKEDHFKDGKWHDEIILAVYRDSWLAARAAWEERHSQRS